jgi:transcriptional regulator with XRE-family HTH domain
MDSTYTPEYRAFLRRLRKAREEAGLSQVEVARRLRRPQPYISRCETGDRRVDVGELVRLAKLYGKPAGWFFDG